MNPIGDTTLLNPLDCFPGTLGQDALKTELYESYVGANKAGIPLPHGLLISPPGFGKSACFIPGIANMLNAVSQPTKYEVVGPFGVSLNMKLDDLVQRVSTAFAVVQARGNIPIVVLEELSNIGRPNAGRLLTLLSEGMFTTLRGDTWNAGTPGKDWFMLGCCNDDGNFLDALSSRLTFFRFSSYSNDDLAEIGTLYAHSLKQAILAKNPGFYGLDEDGLELNGSELDYTELQSLAPMCDSPRDMINATKRMLSLEGLGQKHTAEDVRTSLRIDTDGLNADNRRVLVTLLDLGGRASLVVLSKAMKARISTVQNLVIELMQAGLVNSGKGPGNGTSLTFEGTRRAAEIKCS